MAWELGAGLGHLSRLRPVAEALLSDGCTVYCAARRVEAARVFLRELSERTGRLRILKIPALSGLPEKTAAATRASTLADVLANLGFAAVDSLFPAAEQWFRLLAAIDPDLVISDFSPIANFVARRRVPLVVLGSGYTIPPRTRSLPPIRPWLNEVPATSAAAEARISDAFNLIAKANGLARVETLADLLHGDATFVCTLPQLDPYAGTRDTPVHVPYNFGCATKGARSPSDPGDVFLYLKPPHPHLDALLNGLHAAPLRVVAYLGRVGEATRDVALAPRITILQEAPALPDVLANTRLLVHHGGLGTAHAGLFAGVPQLTLPLHLEDHVTSYRLCRLGVCRSFSATVPFDGQALDCAIGHAMSSATDRVAAVASQLSRLDPARTLSLVLETARRWLPASVEV